MYELIQAGEHTWYIDCPAKMGVYIYDGAKACLIDSGSDKDAGKKALHVLESNGWKLEMVLNTHSHADHIGGNRLLQERTGCKIYSVGTENSFIRDPFLEPSMLYGGYPYTGLRTKFLQAQPSISREVTRDVLPQGMTMLRLDGHSVAMAGFQTPDSVCFLADCVASKEALKKYQVSYLYCVRDFLDTLDRVEALTARLFVPSHAPATGDIQPLVELNREKTLETAAKLLELCREPVSFDQLLQSFFLAYSLRMDLTQHALVGSTLRSYLSWLEEEGKLQAEIQDYRLVWKTVENL